MTFGKKIWMERRKFLQGESISLPRGATDRKAG